MQAVPEREGEVICPTCEGNVKFDIIDGKCKACRLGVVQDWNKPATCQVCGHSHQGTTCRERVASAPGKVVRCGCAPGLHTR